MTLTLTAVMLGSVGCSNSSTKEEIAPPANADGHDEHAGHFHPSEGLHQGSLIELGNEEYYAELVHDETAGSVTIYVLNPKATQQVPIEQTEITINVKHDGKPEQFQLAASPDAGDPEGKSSRFVSTDSELGEHLDDEAAAPTLVLTIAGKSYRGTIAHDHEH